jgi:cytochrome c oxidase subunit 3
MANFQARGSQNINGPVPSRELSLRTHPLVLGMVMFLVSDLMIFGGLIASYFALRGISAEWPPPGIVLDAKSAAIGTIMLALSSFTMLCSTHFLARNAFLLARLWLGATMLLGAAFVLQTYDGWLSAPFRMATNAYGSVYFVMTGFHALHVTAGVVLLGTLFFNMRKTAFQRDERAGAEAIGFFWHFVFLIWLLVGGTIFVLR